MFKKIKSFALKFWWVFIILLVITGLVWWKTRDVKPERNYQVVKPEYRTITKNLEVSGNITAEERVDLFFAVPSRLSWVGVKEGDMVKKWQAIASVDTKTLQKQLMQDLNSYSKERIDFDYTKDNYKGDAITNEIKNILTKAQYDLNDSVLNVEIRDLAIKLSTIISPIDGMVTRIDAKTPGMNVSGSHIFQVVNPNSIYFFSVVDEEDIGLLTLNQEATIELDAYPEQIIQSRVDKIDFTSTASDGGGTGYGIHLNFPLSNADLKYRLNMNGTAEIQISKKENALSVPIDTLINRDGKYYIEVELADKTTSEKEVVLGLEGGEYVEITSGLDLADGVILPVNE